MHTLIVRTKTFGYCTTLGRLRQQDCKLRFWQRVNFHQTSNVGRTESLRNWEKNNWNKEKVLQKELCKAKVRMFLKLASRSYMNCKDRSAAIVSKHLFVLPPSLPLPSLFPSFPPFLPFPPTSLLTCLLSYLPLFLSISPFLLFLFSASTQLRKSQAADKW